MTFSGYYAVDMSMGTVYDAYMDKAATETGSTDDRTNSSVSISGVSVGHSSIRHRQASHVIAWGIGNVTLSDVELAKDGSGREASVSYVSSVSPIVACQHVIDGVIYLTICCS